MNSQKISPVKTLMALLLVAGLSACGNQFTNSQTTGSQTTGSQTTGSQTTTTQTTTTHSNTDKTEATKQTSSHQALNQKMAVQFLSEAEAVQRLVTEDDYLKALSPFDWQAKFKSDRKLSSQELKDYYTKTVMTWDAPTQKKVQTAVNVLERKIADLNLNAPKTLPFILSNGLVESGSAYTREDYIVLPINMIDESNTQEEVNHLVAHEFFHVYSRLNKDHRDALYGTIHFKNLPPVSLHDSIKSMLITNPDAPKMGYGIELEYQGKKQMFLPLILSHSEYDVDSNLPFFAYVRDGLLLVEDAKGIMRPTLEDGAPVFINKDKTNYIDIVQPNSPYLNHPEEVLAENFSMWVADREIKYQEPVDRLLNVMKTIH